MMPAQQAAGSRFATYLPMTDTPQSELGERVWAELRKRKLTPNSASERLQIDRQVLSRFTKGIPPSLETVEKWARKLQLDVNDWRALCGYPRVESRYDAAAFERQLCEELAAHYQEPPFEVTHLRNGPALAPDTLRAVVIRRIARIEQRLRERRREQGLPIPPPLFVTEE